MDDYYGETGLPISNPHKAEFKQAPNPKNTTRGFSFADFHADIDLVLPVALIWIPLVVRSIISDSCVAGVSVLVEGEDFCILHVGNTLKNAGRDILMRRWMNAKILNERNKSNLVTFYSTSFGVTMSVLLCELWELSTCQIGRDVIGSRLDHVECRGRLEVIFLSLYNGLRFSI